MPLQYPYVDARCTPRLCGSIYLCLQPHWAERTVSGIPVAVATVTGVIGQVGLSTSPCAPPANPCYPCPPVPATCTDPCLEICRYQLSVDDSQFGTDPSTNFPWVITNNDILGVAQDACILGQIFSRLCDCTDPPVQVDACSLDYFTGPVV